MAWSGVGKRSVFFENYERLKSCEHATEKSKEAQIIIDICSLLY
jgi:hypothetical protein